MNWSNKTSYWQHHYVIEQSATAFYEMELKYPLVSARVRSGEINQRPDPNYVFKDGDAFVDIFSGVFAGEPLSLELEAQNQEWRDFIKAICGIVSQIFYASRTDIDLAKDTNLTARDLAAHGEATIAKLVSPYWKSLRIYGKHWLYDEKLRDLVLSIVQKQSELDALMEVIDA